MENTREKHPNFWWTIGVLVFIVIVLVALLLFKAHYNGNSIIEYLNYLSVILTIVLSLFSIAFSFYSLLTTSEQMGIVHAAISKIEGKIDAGDKHVTDKVEVHPGGNMDSVMQQLNKAEETDDFSSPQPQKKTKQKGKQPLQAANPVEKTEENIEKH